MLCMHVVSDRSSSKAAKRKWNLESHGLETTAPETSKGMPKLQRENACTSPHMWAAARD